MELSILSDPHLHRAFTLCIALLASASSGVLADGSDEAFAIPDLMGEHTIIDTLQDTVLSRARVEVSSRGLRASNSLDGRQAIMNFSLGRHWFVDRTRRMVHEVPVSTGGRGVSSAPVARDAASARPARLVSGVFAIEPCYPFRVAASTPAQWRGRAVRLIDCVDEDDALQAIQYHDEALHMVIRSVDRRGIAEEFRHIVASNIDAARFLPPLHFDTVDLETFTGARSTLADYAATD